MSELLHSDNLGASMVTPRSKSRIVPIMKQKLAGDDQGTAISVPNDEEPILEDFPGGLLVSYGIDVGRWFELVSCRTCRELGVEKSDLREIATTNYFKLAPSVERFLAGPCFALTAQGYLESSLLLVDWLWDQQKSLVKGPIIAAVPARDVLAFGGLETPGALEYLHKVINRVSPDDCDHPLTDQVLLRRGTSWTTLST